MNKLKGNCPSSVCPGGGTVTQDCKQVELQDPGYETCERSETEAERDTSSPGNIQRVYIHTDRSHFIKISLHKHS